MFSWEDVGTDNGGNGVDLQLGFEGAGAGGFEFFEDGGDFGEFEAALAGEVEAGDVVFVGEDAPFAGGGEDDLGAGFGAFGAGLAACGALAFEVLFAALDEAFFAGHFLREGVALGVLFAIACAGFFKGERLLFGIGVGHDRGML